MTDQLREAATRAADFLICHCSAKPTEARAIVADLRAAIAAEKAIDTKGGEHIGQDDHHRHVADEAPGASASVTGGALSFEPSDEAVEDACAAFSAVGDGPVVIGKRMVAALRAAYALDSRSPEGCRPSQAAQDVLAERARQISDEGFMLEHDAHHISGELALAAASYAYASALPEARKEAVRDGRANADKVLRMIWPEWDHAWFKPTNRRRDLVKAGALILAEIERLDRAAAPLAPAPEGK